MAAAAAASVAARGGGRRRGRTRANEDAPPRLTGDQRHPGTPVIFDERATAAAQKQHTALPSLYTGSQLALEKLHVGCKLDPSLT